MSTRTRTAALVALVATAPFLLVACGDDGGRDGAGGTPRDAGHDAADVRFAARMLPHHEQALELVDIAEGRELSPAVAELVTRIGAAQAPEVAQLASWLEDWRGDTTGGDGTDGDTDGDTGEDDDDGGWMGMGGGRAGHMDGDHMDADHMDTDHMDGEGHMDGDGMHEGAGMPGMMSQAQLVALEAARGRAFERMWLAMMVQHHEGAIEMAQDELEQGEDPAALGLARSIAASQQAEVEEMRDLLDR